MPTLHKLTAIALACAALSANVNANASVIKLEAGRNSAGFQSSANAYRDAVNAQVTGASTALGSRTVTTFDNVRNQDYFGTNANYAWRATINFGVTAAQAGTWAFRAGVDFDYGGAMFLDGVAIDFKANNMWWNYSYAATSQFLAGSAVLSAGNHVLQIYGLEGCCDGSAQAQFKAANAASYITFASTDGLNVVAPSAVPEPATLASIALGLGAMGAMGALRRRRQQRG